MVSAVGLAVTSLVPTPLCNTAQVSSQTQDWVCHVMMPSLGLDCFSYSETLKLV